MLSVAVAAQPQVMRRLISPLPCEWNWQTCIAEYAKLSDCSAAASSLGSDSSRCKLAFRDDTCQTPPKLLHFNCPNDLKRLLETNKTGDDAPSFSQRLNEVRLSKEQLMHAARAGCPDKIAETARLALESAIGTAAGVLHAATRHKYALRACKKVQYAFPEIKSRSCNASWLLSGALQRIGPALHSSGSALLKPPCVHLGVDNTRRRGVIV